MSDSFDKRVEVFNWLYPGNQLASLAGILGCTETSLRAALEKIVEEGFEYYEIVELEAAPGVDPDGMVRCCEFFHAWNAAVEQQRIAQGVE